MSAPISRAFKGLLRGNRGTLQSIEEKGERAEGTERNVKPDPFNYPVWNSRPGRVEGRSKSQTETEKLSLLPYNHRLTT